MIGMIVATDPNGLIGKDNQIPWFYRGDLKLFKEKTVGEVVIMGRKTWESLPEKMRPLPKRANIVVTSHSIQEFDGADVTAASVSLAIASAKALFPDRNIWLMGGGGVYAEGLDYAQMVLETRVPDAVVTTDGEDLVYFPALTKGWVLADSLPHPYAPECELRTWTRKD